MRLLLCKPIGVGRLVELVVMSGSGEVLFLTRMLLHGQHVTSLLKPFWLWLQTEEAQECDP